MDMFKFLQTNIHKYELKTEFSGAKSISQVNVFSISSNHSFQIEEMARYLAVGRKAITIKWGKFLASCAAAVHFPDGPDSFRNSIRFRNAPKTLPSLSLSLKSFQIRGHLIPVRR